MSYIEILATLIILGIIIVPITMSATENAYTAEENTRLEKAVWIAEQEIEKSNIEQPSTSVAGFNVVKEMHLTENYLKVTVTWNVAGRNQDYVLYGTIPVTDYNS